MHNDELNFERISVKVTRYSGRRRIPLCVLVCASAILLFVDKTLGEDFTGRASIIDADTIEIHGQRIRLHGVDAPEKGQECFLPDGSTWRCGQRGALALADFIGESPVSCQPVGTDRYGRIIANCRVRGRDIEEWLVSQGWAMAYRRYSTDYVGAEQAAKNAKRGIWAGTVQPPWEWRREKRNHYSSPPSP